MVSSSADAMGFGKVANATQLGQRLNFAALVRLEPDESLERQCVFAEVLVGDNRLQPGQVRVTLEGGPDDPDRTVRVTTSAVIDEPVVTVSVTLGCTSRVVRKFVAFIDPPGIEMAQSAPADEGLLVPQRADSQVAQLLALVAADAPRPPVRSPRAPVVELRSRGGAPEPGRGRMPAAKLAAEPGEHRVAANRKPAQVRQASLAPRPPRARLQLDAPALLAARTPAAAASAPLLAVVAAVPVPVPEAASAAVADAQAERVAREQQRIQSLEDGMKRLRSESAATQQALAGLQAKLRVAESERHANPLVYTLGGLCALLALGIAALLRPSRGRRAAQWWAAPATADLANRTARQGTVDVPDPSAEVSPERSPAVLLPSDSPTAVDVSLPGMFLPPVAGAAPPASGQVVPVLLSVVAGAVPDSSVEELIDLEQQAEFFIVLGQDDAAIDLLTSHVRGDACASPLPFLKLLEIHHRLGDRAAYESIRAHFNRRFNAYAPDWNGDIQEGRSLEEYPEVLGLLQRLWGTPSRAMAALDASVFRRATSDATFDLPAYRELLFLYSIARDRAEHAGHAGQERDDAVDLLLPLDPAAALDASRAAPVRSSDGRPMDFQSSEFITAPLDLDVSLAELPARPGALGSGRPRPGGPKAATAGAHHESDETVPSALRRPTGYSTESAYVDLELEPVGSGVDVSVR